jgi:predicted dehydrogenase
LFNDELEIDGKVFDFENAGVYFGKACYGWGHAPLFDDFYHCVQTNTPFKLNAREGAKALKIVLSAYQSNGRKIEVE